MVAVFICCQIVLECNLDESSKLTEYSDWPMKKVHSIYVLIISCLLKSPWTFYGIIK